MYKKEKSLISTEFLALIYMDSVNVKVAEIFLTLSINLCPSTQRRGKEQEHKLAKSKPNVKVMGDRGFSIAHSLHSKNFQELKVDKEVTH